VNAPKERDTLVPALALGCFVIFIGVYAGETLRLIVRGEFYMPTLPVYSGRPPPGF
jgi:hypothetical protein